MNNLYCKYFLESLKTLELIELYKSHNVDNKKVILRELNKRGFTKLMLEGGHIC